ncbi:hypothetical protein BJ970_001570 [Saccharopolyspora phatthalungensis]|uniref:Uncharacterized protein n=1 Tax=Saccharopolyspora phatthalungensis TaxID=664693 RepID=A0A840Q0H6_9PSEU|nr:hypothetical protein [Saccharopolyspora phatthalungensis]MBB5154036.1 hypothetical protein [Saccharopolyspora phatthalungensis]
MSDDFRLGCGHSVSDEVEADHHECEWARAADYLRGDDE